MRITMNVVDVLKNKKVKAAKFVFRYFFEVPFVTLLNWLSNIISNRNAFSLYSLKYSKEGCKLTDGDLQNLIDFYLSMHGEIKETPDKDLNGGM